MRSLANLYFLGLRLLYAAAVPCRLSNVHGDAMVLQRAPQATTLYGFAPPNAIIITTFRGTNLTATASAAGEWRQLLPVTPASTPSAGGESISFSCSTGEAFSLRNILFGDVVLCGGQCVWMRAPAQRPPPPLLSSHAPPTPAASPK